MTWCNAGLTKSLRRKKSYKDLRLEVLGMGPEDEVLLGDPAAAGGVSPGGRCLSPSPSRASSLGGGALLSTLKRGSGRVSDDGMRSGTGQGRPG